MKEGFVEKRKAKRFRTRFMCRYLIEGEKELKIAPVENISARGILLEMEKIIPIETGLSLQLDFPPASKTILCKGKVIRVEEKLPLLKYSVGICFTEINKTDQEIINNYIERMDIDKVLRRAVELQASDVHLTAGLPPVVRIYGELKTLGTNPYTRDDLREIIYGILSDRQRIKFEKELELDCSYALSEGGRFRVNIHRQQGNIEAAFRVIPQKIPTFEELGLPEVVKELALKKSGFIIVTGPAGSGKSTTLAAMLELINQTSSEVIVTLEDPIEFIFTPKKSIIKQREIGIDALSFNNALKHVLRQDPDVILIGEMRDLESVATALTAAETGHLVFTTLHTAETIQAVNRIIDMFPANQQAQIRLQLAECLVGVIGQLLFPRKDRQGLVLATEVLIVTSAISSLIRQGQTQQIYTLIQTGRELGMRTMDMSLLELYRKGLVDYNTILPFAKDPTLFKL
ncbi:MAG: PilT/PilU family type 4a pilus ATPase [Candidatus Omnitrophica bacterium]|nr:PilT/PilU family type 4a pilus ATPase [Candidatus Omnitrophota bacterium]MCM8793757.1 PilT/PilU family type 4a pilus ATPase [Candidatus Omnitrophota bacterium]